MVLQVRIVKTAVINDITETIGTGPLNRLGKGFAGIRYQLGCLYPTKVVHRCHYRDRCSIYRHSRAANEHGEFVFGIEYRIIVNSCAGGGIVNHIYITMTVVLASCIIDSIDIDRNSVRDRIDKGRSGLEFIRCRFRQLDNIEDNLFAGGISEAHLELSVNGQQSYLVGNIGQKQDRYVTGGNVGQIGIKFGADTEIIRSKIKFSNGEEFAVGTELEHDLAVKCLLRGEDRIYLRTAGNCHRRGKGRKETAQIGVLTNHLSLHRDLLFDRGKPLISGHIRGQFEIRISQRKRIVYGRQALEKFHSCREVINRKTYLRYDHDTARDLHIDKDTKRPEFTKGKADRQAADTGHAEPALNPDEEYPVRYRCGGIERSDYVKVLIELEDTAYQGRIDLTTEQLALDADAYRGDVDNRKLTLQQQLR